MQYIRFKNPEKSGNLEKGLENLWVLWVLEKALLYCLTIEKTVLGRGRTEIISLSHNLDLDLWPSIPCELCS